MVRHWCHICNSFVHVHSNPLLCDTCGEGFVEVVSDGPAAADAPQPPPHHFNPHAQQIPLNPNNLGGTFLQFLSGMFANPNQQGQFTFHASAAPGQPPPPAHFTFHHNFAQPGAQVHQGAHPMPNHPPFMMQGAPLPFFNFGAQGASLQDLLMNLMGPHNLGDYASDADMQNLLDRLFRQHQSAQIPVSKSFFETLPIIKFTKESATGECAICKCDWEENDEGVDLPCHHVFHKDCIKTWFDTSNLCPMCRYELPTDDKDYEERKKARQAEEARAREDASPAPTSSSSNAQSSTPYSSPRPNRNASSSQPPTIILASSESDSDYSDAKDASQLQDSIYVSSDDDNDNSMDLTEEVYSISDDVSEGEASNRSPHPQTPQSPSVHDPGLDVD